MSEIARYLKLKDAPVPLDVEDNEDSGKRKFRNIFPMQSLATRSTLVCRNWSKGHCARGANCRFAHPMAMPPLPFPLPPFVPQQPSKKAKIETTTKAPSKYSTKLVVDKIPRENCTIAAVHEHFARLGTIVNIELCPESSKAKLQYSTHDEAQSAFSCPDVIFNNRFVRVYWEADEPKQETQEVKRPVDPQVELGKKRMEALDAFLELQKQKEALLLKYLQQEQALLTKLEDITLEETQKTNLLEELKVVEEAIKSMKPSKEPTAQQPILRGGPQIRGRGRASTFVQPRAPAVYKLDLRPKAIRMTPIPAVVGTDPSSIRKLFEKYGQLTDLTVNSEASPSFAIATFLKRTDAEKAMHYLSEEGITFSWKPSSKPTTPNLSATDIDNPST